MNLVVFSHQEPLVHGERRYLFNC